VSNQAKHAYEFGPFRLDTAERLLLRDGKPVQLTPKAYEMLLALVERSGHIIEKDELLKEVWPDQFVEEGNLTQHVFALRKALGESVGGTQYIETVPRRGYRFIADVRMGDAEVVERHARTRVVIEREDVAAKAIDSLAVLPLVNASADPNLEYLSDGITESIINSLSQLPSLKVSARNTMFRYKGREVDAQEVGRELKVGAVLTGRVLQFSDRLIIRAELVDATDGWQLWGAQYDREPSDILVMQEEIAREITEKLQLRLTGEERKRLAKRYTQDAEAYRLYLKGRFHLNKRTEGGLKKGIELFRQAIEIDPCYAAAYAGLADCYTLLGSAGYSAPPPSEAMPRAKAAAMKALEIDDTLAEAHTSLAFVKFRLDWDWAGAELEFGRALELNPNYAAAHHWYAVYLSAMGRHEEALPEIERALELDPLSLIISSAAGRLLQFAGRYDEAVGQCRKALEMDPNYGEARLNLGLAYEQMGRPEEAIAELQTAIDLSRNRALIMAVLGHAYAKAGRLDEARATLEQVRGLAEKGHASSLDVAIVYAGLGEKDEALAWLQKGCEERSGPWVFLKVEPLYESLRADPRFRELLRRVGLAPCD
jgi:TolB-like protein/Tfp pilus assembly protein PilF